MNTNRKLSIGLPGNTAEKILSSKDASTVMGEMLYHIPLRLRPMVAGYVLKGDYHAERYLGFSYDINGEHPPDPQRPGLKISFYLTEEEYRLLDDYSTNHSENVMKPILASLESEPIIIPPENS